MWKNVVQESTCDLDTGVQSRRADARLRGRPTGRRLSQAHSRSRRSRWWGV